MKTVYLVRHGQTDGNTKGYSQNGEESLNSTGFTQVAVLAERCKELNFSQIVSSDMVRTQQTADAIAKVCPVTVKTTSLLREVTLSDSLSGPVNGLHTNPQIMFFKDNLEQHLEDQNDDWFAEFGAESYRAIQIRARKALALLIEEESENILVVSHDTFMKFIFAEMLLGKTATMQQLHLFRKKLEMNNTGITKVQYDQEKDRWHLQQYNDIAHFADN